MISFVGRRQIEIGQKWLVFVTIIKSITIIIIFMVDFEEKSAEDLELYCSSTFGEFSAT